MRSAILTLAMLILVSMLGCMGSSSGPAVQWSKNIAVYATSKDTKFHDDNLSSVGETGPLISDAKDEKSEAETDKYTQATIEWGKPQPIERVIVKADPGELEFFEIQYQDEQENWQTIRDVKDHIKEAYKVDLNKAIYTRKLRLKVPRQWDSRLKGGQKRRTRSEGGAPVAGYKKIREIEVYYRLSPGEAATTTTQ